MRCFNPYEEKSSKGVSNIPDFIIYVVAKSLSLQRGSVIFCTQKPVLFGCCRAYEFRHNPYFENTSEITNFVVYGKDKISFGFQSQEDPEQRG